MGLEAPLLKGRLWGPTLPLMSGGGWDQRCWAGWGFQGCTPRRWWHYSWLWGRVSCRWVGLLGGLGGALWRHGHSGQGRMRQA